MADRAAMRRTSPTRPLIHASTLPRFLSASLSFSLTIPIPRFTPRHLSICSICLSLSLLQNWFAPGSRATGVNHRENLIALVSLHALFFYAQRYMSIGKSRGTKAIVTNNAKIAFDAGFYDVVNWFALDRTVRPLSSRQIISTFCHAI